MYSSSNNNYSHKRSNSRTVGQSVLIWYPSVSSKIKWVSKPFDCLIEELSIPLHSKLWSPQDQELLPNLSDLSVVWSVRGISSSRLSDPVSCRLQSLAHRQACHPVSLTPPFVHFPIVPILWQGSSRRQMVPRHQLTGDRFRSSLSPVLDSLRPRIDESLLLVQAI